MKYRKRLPRSLRNILNNSSLYLFQICQLSFFHSAALEALAQQRRHNNVFFCLPPGSYPSPATASIEHLLWKGKQVCFYAFGFQRDF